MYKREIPSHLSANSVNSGRGWTGAHILIPHILFSKYKCLELSLGDWESAKKGHSSMHFRGICYCPPLSFSHTCMQIALFSLCWNALKSHGDWSYSLHNEANPRLSHTHAHIQDMQDQGIIVWLPNDLEVTTVSCTSVVPYVQQISKRERIDSVAKKAGTLCLVHPACTCCCHIPLTPILSWNTLPNVFGDFSDLWGEGGIKNSTLFQCASIAQPAVESCNQLAGYFADKINSVLTPWCCHQADIMPGRQCWH